MTQERHWNGEDHNISGDVQGRIREPESQSVHAFSFEGLIPECCSWNTHEQRTEECPASINDQNYDHDVAQLLDICLCKNSLVLENNGDFGEGEGQVVHGDGDP